jgi:transcriptional regulator with GAF, ATPase, and Fis domain
MSKLSVLLLGESGVGKEVVARAIHALSNRQGPFIAINCGALAPNLVESQLFGHVRGAFSGATRDEEGLVRASSGGTLFLDEIGELTPAAQAALLRVLQEQEVLAVGATRAVPVDLRIVAATLRPIDTSASFRVDLYARVAAYVHRIAPLRERRPDIGLLIAALLPRIAAERTPRLRLSADLVTAIVIYDWPRNVRELEQILSVATVTQSNDLLKLDDVGDSLRPKKTGEVPIVSSAAKSRAPLGDADVVLRDSLTRLLAETHGNVSEVARSMGKTRMQIHRWMKRFGLEPESFREPES